MLRVPSPFGIGSPFGQLRAFDPASLFAPTMTVSTSSIGETFSITIDDLTGTPAPTLAFDVTVDGSPVTMVDQGGGIWSVTVSETTEPKPVVWSVTASNGVSPDDTTSGTDSVSGPVFPQTLYTSNDQGFVVDAYAASSLWQDDAETIPATAHDDPVALWEDTSGSTNGVDHSTALATNRPKLQIVGNRRTILSDGISDKLTSVTRDFTGKGVFTACFAIRSLDTNGNINPVWTAHDNNDGLRLISAPHEQSIPVRFQTDNTVTDAIDAPSPTYDPPLDMVIIVEGDIPSGTLKLWIDGTLVASETGVNFHPDWQAGVSRLFGDYGVYGEEDFAKVEIARGMEISRGLTASEFTDLLNWGQAGLVDTGVFTPASLFAGGQEGLLFEMQSGVFSPELLFAGGQQGLMFDMQSGGFSPASLFAGGQEGLLFKPER